MIGHGLSGLAHSMVKSLIPYSLVKNLWFVLVVVAVAGCSSGQVTPMPDVSHKREQTEVVSVEEGQPLLMGTVPTFNATQPFVELTMSTADANSAVFQLCEGDIALILLDRSLTDQERATCAANNVAIVDFYVAERSDRAFIFLQTKRL